jgi:hypothetical protein
VEGEMDFTNKFFLINIIGKMFRQRRNQPRKMMDGHHDPREDAFVWTNNAYQYYQNHVRPDQLEDFWRYMEDELGVNSSNQMITHDLISQWHWETHNHRHLPPIYSLDQLMEVSRQLPAKPPLSVLSIIESFMKPTIVVYQGQPHKVMGDVDLMRSVSSFKVEHAAQPISQETTIHLLNLDEILFTTAPRLVEEKIIYDLTRQ